MHETTVGAYEAKTKLGRLLTDVENGTAVTITRHGRPIAKLVPADAQWAPPDVAIEALRVARSGVRRGRHSVRTMIDEGRR